MTSKRWQVVVVNFPFVEGHDSKRRPALVVSADALAAERGVLWVMMITTAKAGPLQGDIAISQHEEAGLPEACVIRPSRLATISETMVVRRLGEISTRDRNAVQAQLKRYLP